MNDIWHSESGVQLALIGSTWRLSRIVKSNLLAGQPACFGHINDQEAFSMYIHDWVTENTTSRLS